MAYSLLLALPVFSAKLLPERGYSIDFISFCGILHSPPAAGQCSRSETLIGSDATLRVGQASQGVAQRSQ